jgi:S1-C subfamily serine protease
MPKNRLRAIHLAITLALALALAVVGVLWAEDAARAQRQLQARSAENGALKKRAEAAEANTRLMIDRFAETMKNLAAEAGHFSGRALARHQKSFVQVYSFYRQGRKDMATAGTACYLGGGYFLTAKHVVVQQAEGGKPAPKTDKIEMRIDGRMLPAQLLDAGETPPGEPVDVEDWALLHIEHPPDDLVALKTRPAYPFSFGERLVRYGNDSNRGIAVAAGYVAQVSERGWVSWLVDSLPGCSGGGVLNARDELVGLNGGYLDGSTRLAVIIPVRDEMLRKVPKEVTAAAAHDSPPASEW